MGGPLRNSFPYLVPFMIYSRGAQLISQIVRDRHFWNGTLEVVGYSGVWGSGHSGVQAPGAKPLVRSHRLCPPEADDDLLIQQQNFCSHSYV